jgi:hypothetical protein
MPTFTGGPITPGTYVLTKYADYLKKPAPQDVAVTVVIAGNNWSEVLKTPGFLIRGDAEFSVAGSSITFAPTCPAGSEATTQYIATATEFMYELETGVVTWYAKL